MLYAKTLTAIAATVLLPRLAAADGLYTKNSPVLQLDKKSYDRLIANSNYTSVSFSRATYSFSC